MASDQRVLRGAPDDGGVGAEQDGRNGLDAAGTFGRSDRTAHGTMGKFRGAVRHGRVAIFLSPAVLSLALGLWGITREYSMWRDEAATWQSAHRSLAEIGHLVGQVDVVHGLYYVVMHGVFALFGDSLVTLRLPSVLATATACGLTALVGARLSDRWAGIGAGLALAVIPAVQEFAQEGRSYALVLAFVVLATWLLISALERPGSRRWAWYAVAILIAALLNWFSLFALVAHGVTVACGRPDRARRVGWLLAAFGAVLAALPLILASRAQASQVSWIKPLGWSTLLGVLVTVTITALCSRLAHARMPGSIREHAPRARVNLATVGLPLCAVPQVGLTLISLIKPLYVTRYVLFAYAGLALLIGALLAVLATRLRTPAAILLPAALASAFLALLPIELRVRTEQNRVDDVLTAAAAVGQVRGAADGVLYIPAARRDTALVSPHAFAGLRDLALAQGPVESGTLKGIEAGPRDIERAILGARRIVLVTDPGPRQDDSTADRAKQRTLGAHFVRCADSVERGRRVSVYERREPARYGEMCTRSSGSTVHPSSSSWRAISTMPGRREK
ncbi:glycosyltransferase family 39 protein [Streptomyces pinistramenti]|uniref:glycosyltransferase family 39 protein n=1 Tax=Streptomyces pinistramenti TaxID=2884812 RepID=UPI001D07D06B|nr:glycosyltransferase family 39 protein [Streptomyces pinistramenti]MCB5912188.1 glycosyltransferase family 39 protein [Streptomyces pinistramenti]